MARTTLQRIIEIAHLRVAYEETHGKIGAKRVAQLYEEKGCLSKKSEQMKESFVDAALAVTSRAFSLPGVSEVLNSIEHQYGLQGPCFGASVFKLEGMVKNSQRPN